MNGIGLSLIVGICFAQIGTSKTSGQSIELLLSFREAASAVDSVVDPAQQARLLVEMARARRRAGDAAEADLLISRSLKIAESLKESAVDEAQAIVATVTVLQVEWGSGEVARALDAVAAVDDERVRRFVRNDLIAALGGRKDYRAALAVCSTIEDLMMRDLRIEELAWGAATNSGVVDALAITTRIEDLYSRMAALTGIATSALDDGDLTSAKRIAAVIDRPVLLVSLLCRIAEAQLELGDRDGANDAVQQALRTTTDAGMNPTDTRLVIVQAKLGDFADAPRVAEGIGDVTKRRAFRKQISIWLSSKGSYAQALSVARLLLENGGTNDDVLPPIARDQCSSGDGEGGLRTANEIRSASVRAGTMIQIAVILMGKSDPERAKSALASALRATEEVETGGGTKVILLRKLAAAEALAGNSAGARGLFDQAFQAVEAYTDADYRSSLGRDIAKAESECGFSKEARDRARNAADPRTCARVLLGVIDGILSRQPVDQGSK